MSTFAYYHQERPIFTRKLHTDFYNPSLKVKRRNCLILWLARNGLWEKFADIIYFLNRLGRKWGYMWSFVTGNSKSHIYFYNINWWDPQMPKQPSREQHSWQRGPNPLFYEKPSYIAYPPPFFFIFCPPPPSHLPCHLQPPPPLLFLLSCFFDWMSDCTTFDVLFYLMILWIYTCWALVHLYQKDFDVHFMQQGIKFTEVLHIMWFFAGTLIWYHIHTNTHTQKDIQHTHGPVDYTPI